MLSMTGYGESLRRENGLVVRCELRTVNNRHFKSSCRVSDGYSAIEPRIEAILRDGIRRGTAQVNLQVVHEGKSDAGRINEAAISDYFHQLRQLQQKLGQNTEIALEQLLTLPGVLSDSATSRNIEEDWPTIDQAVRDAVDALNTMRADEGRSLAADLTSNCQAIESVLTEIEQIAPQTVDAYQQRLLVRINQLLAEHDLQVEPSAVIREVGIFAERVDISEETVRLRSHLEQFNAIMQSETAVGRKLEFLIQEILRETNTIGSKANDTRIAQHVVQIKSNIERLREMIQNVE